MRIFFPVSILFILLSCSEEKISVTDGNWSRFIYETSDVATVKINQQSNPTFAFRNNYFQILGPEGLLVADPKESLADFDPLTGSTATSLEADNLFVFGGVNRSGVDPVFGIKLMTGGFEALSDFQDNFEEGLFLPGNMSTFYALFRSPVIQGLSGTFEVNVKLVQYDYGIGILDTLWTDEVNLRSLEAGALSEFRGIIAQDQIYFTVQQQLVSYDLTSGNTRTINLGFIPENLFFFEDQIVLHRQASRVVTYDMSLNPLAEIVISGIPAENDTKTTIVKVFQADDRVFVVIGRSGVKEVRLDYLAETSLTIELLSLDNQWTTSGQTTVLTGSREPGELLWEKYELIAQDVRRGRFAVFLFRRALANDKYEYLAKRVNF